MPSSTPPPPPVQFIRPTAEMRVLSRVFERMLDLGVDRPAGLPSVIAGGMVTPNAHFANLSLLFQAYLFDVFHQRAGSRIVHGVLQPLTVVAVLAGLAQFRFGGALAADAGMLLVDANGAWLGAALLAGFYALQALLNRMPLLAATMTAFCAGSAAAATAWYSAFAVPDPSWYAPTALAANPWLWVGIFTFCVTLSHVPEPSLPPRLNGRRSWSTIRDMMLTTEGGWLPVGLGTRRFLRLTGLGFLWGNINELWGSWRLVPVTVLNLLWAAGYQSELRARFLLTVRAAIASGDPALDYIGIGGATPASQATPAPMRPRSIAP